MAFANGQIKRLLDTLTTLESLLDQLDRGEGVELSKQMLDLCKDCRAMDSLFGTQFFEVEELKSLEERMREMRQNTSQMNRIQEQVQQLSQSKTWSIYDDDDDDLMDNDLVDKGNREAVPPANNSLSEELRLCGELSQVLKRQLSLALSKIKEVTGVAKDESADQSMESASSSNTNEAEDSKENAMEKEEEAGASTVEKGDEEEAFSVLDSVQSTHKFQDASFHPMDTKGFFKVVRKEINLLKSSLPKGIKVKAYEDRMDLYSVMIMGPRRTPYEDGLFFIDVQLPPDYPRSPPKCHYWSYCADRLNPNLYEDGKVCVSLLGTWSGKGSETWTDKSNLLQVLVSIQGEMRHLIALLYIRITGLILVGEPYYNEAGYERHRDTQQGAENSRLYNEMALLKLVQSMTNVAQRPPSVFKAEVKAHFQANGKK